MYYIKEKTENIITINKSKFITTLIPVYNQEQANEELKKIKNLYSDATHNCYAYIIGDNLEIQKCSDDGEPQKTAGFPMLDALKKKNITNILAVVTRYFGGILLGASGLIRAYSTSVIEACDKATLYQKALALQFDLALDYKEYNQLSKLSYLNIKDIVFNKDVVLSILIALEDKERLLKDLNNILKENININFSTTYSLKKIL